MVDRIRQLCQLNGISLTKLEEALNLGNGTIGKWAKQNPRIDKLRLVAEYFDVPVDFLLTGKGSVLQDGPTKEEMDIIKMIRMQPDSAQARSAVTAFLQALALQSGASDK